MDEGARRLADVGGVELALLLDLALQPDDVLVYLGIRALLALGPKYATRAHLVILLGLGETRVGESVQWLRHKGLVDERRVGAQRLLVILESDELNAEARESLLNDRLREIIATSEDGGVDRAGRRFNSIQRRKQAASSRKLVVAQRRMTPRQIADTNQRQKSARRILPELGPQLPPPR